MVADNIKEILDKLSGWGNEAIRMLPNFVLAVIIVVIFNFLARFIRRFVFKFLNKFTTHEELNKLISILAYLGVMGLGVFFALSVLELDKTVTSLLAGVGIIGLALGFAFQDIAANFMSGIILSIKTPFSVGDYIEGGGVEGIIEKIDLRVTEIKRFTGEYVTIPNKDILQNKIVNYNKGGKRRIDLACGISYGEDLERVKKIALEAINSIDVVIDKDVTTVLFDSFGDSSINFKARYWVSSTQGRADYLVGVDAGVIALKKAFDRNDIMIPFPIRTLDFGIKGGEKLNEVLDMKQLQNGSRNNGGQSEKDGNSSESSEERNV
ncbi:MAG: hypothetical protein Kapaf2KO_10520 [Candidatus Kapaibacteriales bacterium]